MRTNVPHTLRREACGPLWVWVCLLAWPLTVGGAEGPPVLRRVIGERAALAVEVTDLPALYGGVRSSRWLERVSQSSLARRWRDGVGYAALTRTLMEVERRLEQPFPAVVDGLARNGVWFSLEPIREGDVPGWLLAGRGANADRVAELVALWNRLEQARIEARTADGFSWTARQVGDGPNGNLAYVVRGDAWWLSNREDLLRLGVERATAEGPQPETVPTTEGGLDWEREFSRLPERSHVKCVLRARAWDEALRVEQGLQSSDPGDRFGAEWWRGTDAVSCAFGFDADGMEQGPTIELRASWREASRGWSDVVQRAMGGASFLERVPADALITLAGRIQPLSLWNLLPIPTDEATRRELTKVRSVVMGLCFGLDPFDDILAALEANWGLSIVPLKTDVPGRWPLALVAVWELPGEAKQERNALLVRGLSNAVRTGLTVWSVAINDKSPERGTRLRAEPAREGSPSGDLVWLEGLPEGEPAYAAGDRHFALATSPEALRAFLDTSASRPRWSGGESYPTELAASQNLWTHVAVKRLRSWLGDNKSSLAEAIARWQKVEPRAVERRLERLHEGLELADDLVLGAKFETDGVVVKGAWVVGAQ